MLKYGSLPDLVLEDGPYDVMCPTLYGEVFPNLIRVLYYRSRFLSQVELKNEPFIKIP